MNKNYEKAVNILKNNHQEHIIPIIDKLNENRKDALIEQILELDFKELEDIYTGEKSDKKFDNIEKVNVIDESSLSRKDLNEYITIGKSAIQNHELAVAIMAGGQGTRLRT